MMSDREEIRGGFGFGTQRIGRRTLVRGGLAGAAGLAAAALIGCGDDDDEEVAATPAATVAPTATVAATVAAPTAAATAAAAPAEPDYITRARADGAPFAYNRPEPDETPRKGGIFRYPQASGHSSHDPIVSAGATTESTNGLVGDFVVGYNLGPSLSKYAVELNPDFGLATSWEASPDGMQYTFNIREANFHNVAPTNGRAMVANDVKLAYERMLVGQQSGILGTIGSVDAPDDRTFVVDMALPDADILVVMGNRRTPVYAPEAYDAGIANTTPIGTGAMILDKDNTVKDQVMVYTRNPDYWAGEPYLDGLELVTLPDLETQRAAFRSGQVHFSRQPPLELFKEFFEEMPGLQVTVDPILWASTIYAVNPNVEPFNDVRVRRALKLAQNVVKDGTILNPVGWVTGPSFGWPFVFGEDFPSHKSKEPDLYPEEFGPYWKYDPGEAKKLLSAAGVENPKWRHIGPRQFSGDTTSRDALWLEDMQAIGADIEFLNVDYSVFNAQYYGQGFKDPSKWQSESIQGWSSATPRANGYFWENLHSQSSTNHFATNDAEVDRLADLQRSELDPDQRQETIRELFDYFNDQAYWMDKATGTWVGFWVRPEVRWFRFNSPYVAVHWFWDWGYGVHKAWLGDPLQETPTIALESSGLL